MTEIIKFSKEFMPHVVRLFYPDVDKVDARLSYFTQMFTIYEPSPEQSCLMLKGKDRLMACAYLTSFEKMKPGLVYVHLAVNKDLPAEQWSEFWERCVDLAGDFTSSKPIFRLFCGGQDIPPILRDCGFNPIREQIELQAQLDQLPPVQGGDTEDFKIVTLADQPDAEATWLDIFNQGLTVFWDISAFDSETFFKLRKLPGFDFSAFRLGYANGEPIAALYYTVIDINLGVVRINAAATPSNRRSKGFGRRMIRETLIDLRAQGYKTAVIYTDSANQATNLLYKMLGFAVVGTGKVLESSTQPVPKPVEESQPLEPPPVSASKEEAAADEDTTGNKGFYPGLQSVYGSKRDK